MYSKASLYLISNAKLEGLASIPNPTQLVMDEIEHHNILRIIERMNHEPIK
nr:MAG TPA: hypothetical protein [Caudoviricetes sp.]